MEHCSINFDLLAFSLGFDPVEDCDEPFENIANDL